MNTKQSIKPLEATKMTQIALDGKPQNDKGEPVFLITIFESRYRKHIQSFALTLSELEAWFKSVTHTSEPSAEYLKMNDEQKTKRKDVGGFSIGFFDGDIKAVNLIGGLRLAVLDYDGIKGFTLEQTIEILKKRKPNTIIFIYPTHKCTKECLHIRVIFPLTMCVDKKQYRAFVDGLIDSIEELKEFADKSASYRLGGLYFWSSLPKDVDIEPITIKGDLLEPQSILNANIVDLPENHAEIVAEVGQLGDPRKKQGIVGDFCKCYSMREAIEAFLSDVYDEAGKDRYKYVPADSVAGAWVINDYYLYSHHSSDLACTGHAVNPFDVVRLHKYKELDKGKTYADITKAPSYKAMVDFASSLPKVRALRIKQDFGSLKLGKPAMIDTEADWFTTLEREKKSGNVRSTMRNLRTILDNDPNLKGRFRKNKFSSVIIISKDVFWLSKRHEPKDRMLTDDDEYDLAEYLDVAYHMENSKKILHDMLTNVANDNAFHPLLDYFESLKWDGTPRVERLVINYLGADDTKLNRAITKIFLVGCAARAYEPTIKLDYCFVFAGEEGIGKSSLLKILGGDYYLDTPSIAGKDGVLQLQGYIIAEISELAGYKTAEVEYIKGFITRTNDIVRKPYGRNYENYVRQCVLCGTTNETNFLRSQNGNRRFLIIVLNKTKRLEELKSTADVRKALMAIRDQVWAEAIHMYKTELKTGKFNLYLNEELEALARVEQKNHNVNATNPIYTSLDIFLKTPITDNWDELDTKGRRSYYHGDITPRDGKVQRKKMCAMEFLTEYHNYNKEDKSYRTMAGNVNNWMKSDHPDWKHLGRVEHPLYGRVDTFECISSTDATEDKVADKVPDKVADKVPDKVAETATKTTEGAVIEVPTRKVNELSFIDEDDL
ncbi:MAG: virulence-associated E family protein [Prevotella sp.]|nr:virulence-associated E family protein [Prevotella sp.]